MLIMIQLTEKEPIEILMMIGFDDSVRTHEEVWDLFNNLHQDQQQITRSVFDKTLKIII